MYFGASRIIWACFLRASHLRCEGSHVGSRPGSPTRCLPPGVAPRTGAEGEPDRWPGPDDRSPSCRGAGSARRVPCGLGADPRGVGRHRAGGRSRGSGHRGRYRTVQYSTGRMGPFFVKDLGWDWAHHLLWLGRGMGGCHWMPWLLPVYLDVCGAPCAWFFLVSVQVCGVHRCVL